jgi:hypothetical protein
MSRGLGTALTLSAEPATSRHAAATQMLVVRPRKMIATAHTATAKTTIRPRRRTWTIHPVENAATIAPAR